MASNFERLRTWEPIPQGSALIERPDILRMAKEGGLQGITLTLDQVKARVTEHTKRGMPDDLMSRLGFDKLIFEKYADPNGTTILYAGYPRGIRGHSRIPLNAAGVIELDRYKSENALGSPARESRLLPFNLSISGVDSKSGRIVDVSYRTEYPNQESLDNLTPTLYLARIAFTVNEADGTHFPLHEKPIEICYPHDPTHFVTGKMVNQIDPSEKQPMRLVRITKNPTGFLPSFTRFEVYGDLSKAGFYANIDSETHEVKVGKKGSWEMHLPNILPQASSNL